MTPNPEEVLPPLKPLPPIHNPSALWVQDSESVGVKIQLCGVTAISLRVTSKQMLFWTMHTGRRYVLLIDFFDEVIASGSSYVISGAYVGIYFEKLQNRKWPRLIAKLENVSYIQRDLSVADEGEDIVLFSEIRETCGLPDCVIGVKVNGGPPGRNGDGDYDFGVAIDEEEDDDDIEKVLDEDEDLSFDSDDYGGGDNHFVMLV